MSEGLTNAQAARLLGVSPNTVGRLSHRFRRINNKGAKGQVVWRADVIRRAVEIRARPAEDARPVSVERHIEQALREVDQ